MNKNIDLQNLVSRVADRLANRGDASALVEKTSRPLVMEALEPRILFSGAPAPAPAPAPAEAPAAQEAPAPAPVAAAAEEASAPAPEVAVPAPTEVTAPEATAAEAATEGAGETAVILTDTEVSALAEVAAGIWVDSGISADQSAALAGATYQIADLGDVGVTILGSTEANLITIDDDAAGRGWSIDDTPGDGEAASSTGIDLLSVLLHEQGHILGLDGANGADDIMNGVFVEGERRLPDAGQADGAVALSLEGVHYATIATISEDFESLSTGSTALPTNWSYVNVNGGSNAYITATGNGGGVGAQITGDNTTNANQPPGSYIVNDGSQPLDLSSSITGTFDYYTTGSLGRAQGGVFMFGDVQTGIVGASDGTYLGMQMMSDSFGNRGGVIDGSGTQVASFTGNQKHEEWYNIEFTWTPTSGTTGNFSATGTSTSSSSNWSVSYNGYTFDSNEAYFGFGAGDYFNNLNTAVYDNISITGTVVSSLEAVDDTGTTDEDTVLNLSTGGTLTGGATSILANDTPTDGAVTDIESSESGGPVNLAVNGGTATIATGKGATVTMNHDGTFSYDPTGSLELQALGLGESTTDSFTYTMTDSLASAQAATLVAYYPLNDGNDGDPVTGADDLIDDPNHPARDATVEGSGGTWVNDAERGIVFSTTEDDRLNAGTMGIEGDFAWSVWVKTGENDVVVGTRSGTYLRLGAGGVSGSWANINFSPDVNDNAWHHLTLQRVDDTLSVYVDGVFGGSTTKTGPLDSKLEIGGSSRYSEDLTGLVSDVAIWDGALSLAQIQALAAGTKADQVVPTIETKTATVTLTINGVNDAPEVSVATTGEVTEDASGGATESTSSDADQAATLVAYFPLNDGAAGTTVTGADDLIDDASHPARDATVEGSGGTWVDDPTRGIVFSTTEDDRLNAGTMGIDGDFAWSVWVKTDETSVAVGTRSGTYLRLGAGGVSGNWATINFSPDVNDNTWHHLLLQRVDDTLSVYVDGVSGGSTTKTGPLDSKLEIGGSSRYSEDLLGLVSDVAIWDGALTLAQIEALAAGQKPTEIFSDVDLTDTHSVSAPYKVGSAAWDGGTLTTDQINAMVAGSTFNADANGWNYEIANSAIQFIDEGETVTLGFDLTVTDNSGAANNRGTETVTITINGAKDLEAVDDDYTGAPIDEDTVLNIPAPGVLDNDTGVGAIVGTDTTLTEGAVTMNGDGSFEYDPTGSATIQALNVGDSLTDTFTYTITDEVFSPATLSHGSDVLVSENNANFNISVFDGKARYDNSGTGAYTSPPLVTTPFGDGTVEAYNFVVSGNGVTDPISYASGGGIAPDPYDPNPGSGGYSNNSGQNWADVWTTSDPDTQSKNFASSASGNRTHAGHGEIQGTVDISGYKSGTVYFPHGTYQNNWTIEVVMSGSGQPELTETITQGGNGPRQNFGWITDFSFADAELYDTLTYTYTNGDLDGSRARFMGVIFDGEAYVPGATDTATVSIKVTGVNDDPEPTDNTYTVGEDDGNATLGNLILDDTGAGVDSDPDNPVGALSVTGVNTTGTLGDVSFSAGGSFDYNPNGQFESLAVGETATDTFTYTISDGQGGSGTATVTIVIEGENDDPEITPGGDITGGVTEDDSTPDLTTSGDIAFTDVDDSDLHSATVAADGGNALGGTLTVDATPLTITIDDVTAGVGPGGGGNKTLQTNFDASGSDKLVVVIGGEHGFGGNVGGQFNSVTYGGVSLTEAIQRGTDAPDAIATAAIFYLDDPGDAGDIVVNQANHNNSPYAIYLLSGTAPGVEATARDRDSDVDLTTVSDGSLVISAILNAGPNGGNGAPDLTPVAPLTEDAQQYGGGGRRWTSLSSANTTVATAGSGTYGFTGEGSTDELAIVAASFEALFSVANPFTWNYTVDNTQSAIQELAHGDTLTETFTITLDDGNGGTADQDVTVTVTGVNDAPVLAGANDMNAVAVADYTNDGDLVSDLVSGQITDVDDGSVEGIAITATTIGDAGATFEFSTDGGGTWSDVGAVSDGSALLLELDDLVRYVPNGTTFIGGSLDLRAWDQTGSTAGQQGTKADASTNGGTSPFSTDTRTSNVAIANFVQDGDDFIFTPTAGTDNNIVVTMVGGELRIADRNGHEIASGPTDNDPSDNGIQVAYTDQNLIIDTNDDIDTITFGANMAGFTGSITAIGGTEVDRIIYQSDLALADGNAVDFSAEEIDFWVGSSLTTENADITAVAAGGIGSGKNLQGVHVYGADLEVTGTGNVTLTGEGGDVGNSNHGVHVTNGGSITTAGGNIDLDGQGGGNSGSVSSKGVMIHYGSSLSAGGTGTITIDGTAGDGFLQNEGVFILGADLTVADGDMTINGTGTGTSGGDGVSMTGTDLVGTGAGNILITGTSETTGGTGNQGVTMTNTTIGTTAGTGTVTLSGTGSTSSLSNNEGVRLANVDIATGGNAAIDIDGVAGGTASGTNNTGVALLGGSTVVAGGSGTVNIDGTAGNGTLMNRGVFITGAGSEVKSTSGAITINGTGNGTVSLNRGIEASFVTIETAADINMEGTGSQSSTGAFNTGISLNYSTVNSSGGVSNITGNGGTGSSFNEGVRMVGGSALGEINVLGVASSSTTGVFNSGVYILSTDMASATGTITGTGGGGLGFNHGIYFHPLGLNFGGSTDGTTTDGNTTSKDIAGIFLPMLMAAADKRSRREDKVQSSSSEKTVRDLFARILKAGALSNFEENETLILRSIDGQIAYDPIPSNSEDIESTLETTGIEIASTPTGTRRVLLLSGDDQESLSGVVAFIDKNGEIESIESLNPQVEITVAEFIGAIETGIKWSLPEGNRSGTNRLAAISSEISDLLEIG